MVEVLLPYDLIILSVWKPLIERLQLVLSPFVEQWKGKNYCAAEKRGMLLFKLRNVCILFEPINDVDSFDHLCFSFFFCYTMIYFSHPPARQFEVYAEPSNKWECNSQPLFPACRGIFSVTVGAK